MATRNGSDVAPLSTGRRVGFLFVTVVAFVIDVMTVVPDPTDGLEGRRWTVFGTSETSLVQFVPIMIAVYAVLLLRRRSPLGALVWSGVVSLAFAMGPEPALPVAGVLISLYTAANLLARPVHAWLALGLAIAAQWTGLFFLPGPEGVDLLLGALLLAGISSALWLFGRRDHDATLAAAGLPDQLAEHGELAAAQERQRIARELHDILAHSVSAMMMQAAGAKAMTTALRQDVREDLRLETVARALATIENTGSESMRELHRLLSVLRGDDDDAGTEAESSAQPGMVDVPRLVELTRQSGLVVELHSGGQPVRLDPSVGLAAYRVVQESLTNAMKHGGRGAVVDIFQNWQPDGLQLQVRCRSGHEGPHPGSLVGGNGLYGLHERVELIGGTFESGWVGDEFVLSAVLPLTPTSPPALENGGGAGGAPGAGGAVRPGPEPHGRHGTGPDGRRTNGNGAAPARGVVGAFGDGVPFRRAL